MGEYEDLVGGLRGRVKGALSSPSPESSWRLRSELHLLEAYLAAHPRAGTPELRTSVAETLALAGETHAIAAEVRGALSDKAYSQLANLVDLGAIGVLAAENILTAEKVTLPRLLMSGLSELLTYLAMRQFVKGSAEVVRGVAQARAPALQAALWAFLRRHRPRATPAEMREAQATVDSVFVKILDASVPPEAQAAFVAGAFQLLLLVHCAELLQLAEAS